MNQKRTRQPGSSPKKPWPSCPGTHPPEEQAFLDSIMGKRRVKKWGDRIYRVGKEGKMKRIKSNRKARHSRGKADLLEGFSIVFPKCSNPIPTRTGDLEAVICPNCGNCIVRDLKKNLVTVGVWILEENVRESVF